MRALNPPNPKRFAAALAVAAVALLAGCDKVAPKDPKAMTGVELTKELERCKQLGMKVYQDHACSVANKESFERFMGRSKEPGR